MAHTELGKQLMDKFLEGAKEAGAADKQPKMEGRSMAVVVSPKVQA